MNMLRLLLAVTFVTGLMGISHAQDHSADLGDVLIVETDENGYWQGEYNPPSPGLYRFMLSGLGSKANMRVFEPGTQNSEDRAQEALSRLWFFAAHPVRIEVQHVGDLGVQTGIVSITPIPSFDPDEPNNTPPNAMPVTGRKIVRLDPLGDLDILRFDPPGAGELFAIVEHYDTQVESGQYQLGISFNGQDFESVDTDYNHWADTFGPLRVDQAPVYIVLRSIREIEGGLEIPVSLSFAPDDPTLGPDTSHIAVVGLELDEEARNSLSLMARAAGASFIAANEVEDLDLALEDATQLIEPESEASGLSWQAWLFIVLLLFVALALIFFARRRRA